MVNKKQCFKRKECRYLHQDLSHLISALATSDVDDDVAVGEFGQGL